MLLLSFLFLITVLDANGQCLLQELPKVSNICSTNISCETTTKNIKDIVHNWGCIKTGGRRYYNYNEGRYNYDLASHYNLYVFVRNLDINVSEKPLTEILDVNNNVMKLNIEGGNLVSVPIEIGSLANLNELSLTYNKIETLNLRKVAAAVSMKYLNVSHNCISMIEDDLVDNTMPSVIASIDLSYNELESIPDDCFARFTQLKYLDLSYNSLKQLDILTFEGIAQLETLRLSNNRISGVGQTFARFKKLKTLSLDNNQLTSLTDLNFRTLLSLERLNISSNLIKDIEDQTLATNKNLSILDLSHNNINIIRQTLFENNINIHELSLSNNNIEHIEGGPFRTTNISFFNIRNNYISGSVEYDTFLGISDDSLDLSNEKLTNLGNKAFSSMGPYLKYLNISTNLLRNITETAFQSLYNLLTLDLSHNNLIDIEFNTSDLIQLKEYFLQNNEIKRITPIMFKNMKSLVKLNLSRNIIIDIEINSFIELINLEELDISGNSFVPSLTANTFRGLYKVRSLDLFNTRLISCLNDSFFGMFSLNYLNISYSQIEMIEYETFKATGAIEIIDLSHNMLDSFHINTSRIPQLRKLYLNNNKLNNVTSKSFENLRLLEKLSLASNNIFHIDSRSLQTLSHLHYLNFYSNLNLHIKSDIFNNLVLSEVSLRKVKQQYDFKNVMNASISTLILSQCEIVNINSIFVYNIQKVLKLDISSNKIKVLDKDSFQNMVDLNWLDVSFNMISAINPGTFLSNYMINILNLNSNNLRSLQFGALDGLRNLRVLNLSNNEIHTFSVNLLYASPSLTNLYLENNNLASIDYKKLSKTSVTLLTVGGNRISCDVLAEWNKVKTDYSLNVTAESLDFNSENLYGIPCITNSPEKTQSKNTNESMTTSEISDIKETVRQLFSYLKSSFNETFSTLISSLEKNPEYIDKILVKSSNSQQLINRQLETLLSYTNKALPQLVNRSENVASDIKLIKSLIEVNNNLTKLDNIDKDLLTALVVNQTINRKDNPNATYTVPKLYSAKPFEVKLDKSTLIDVKILLYLIAVCLMIVILFGIAGVFYKYLYRQSSHRIGMHYPYDSGQSSRNGLEME